MRVLTKAMDSAHPTPEKMEVAVLSRRAVAGSDGVHAVVQRSLGAGEVAALLAAATAATAAAGDA